MDDIQVILYIVIGIFYFLSRSLKKKKAQQQQNTPASESEERGTPQKPLTFEELLREFTEGGSEAAPQEPQTVSKQQSATPLEERLSQPTVYEPVYDFEDEETQRIFEASKLEAQKATKIEDIVPEEEDSHFKGYKTSSRDKNYNPVAEEVREMLQDADGAKKAIILAEILNRRY